MHTVGGNINGTNSSITPSFLISFSLSFNKTKFLQLFKPLNSIFKIVLRTKKVNKYIPKQHDMHREEVIK